MVVTSYETHKLRTAEKKIRYIPGVPFKKPRFDENGNQQWKVKPRREEYWVTNQKGAYSLLIGDEAQKVKNYLTGLWSVLYLQSMRKTLLLTATPIFNTIRVSYTSPSPKSTFLSGCPCYIVAYFSCSRRTLTD